jgi:hypothetical protein
MSYNVLTVEHFDTWWHGLNEDEMVDVKASVDLLKVKGVTLGYPHSSSIKGSRYGHLRELRIQHRGKPIRVLYAFDPNRDAILLLGGNKGGNNLWYEKNIPIAEKNYELHLKGLKHGKTILATHKKNEPRSTKSRRH